MAWRGYVRVGSGALGLRLLNESTHRYCFSGEPFSIRDVEFNHP